MSQEHSFSAASLFGRLERWFQESPGPECGCVISSDGVAAARWRAKRRNLEAFSARELAAETLRPSPLVENVLKASALNEAVADALRAVAGASRRVTLVVPDLAVRLLVLHFDSLPERAEEALALLRWRLKKSLPFDVGEAMLSYQVQRNPAGGHEVVLAVAQRRIIRRYEEAVEAAGFYPGLVLPSTLALLPLTSEEPHDGGTLVAHLGSDALSTAIVKDGLLYFYRSVESPFHGMVLGAQTFFDELYPSLVYFQDTWGSAVRRVVVAGVEDGIMEIGRLVEREAGCAVRSLDWERWLPAGVSAAERRGIGRLGLPLLGLMASA